VRFVAADDMVVVLLGRRRRQASAVLSVRWLLRFSKKNSISKRNSRFYPHHPSNPPTTEQTLRLLLRPTKKEINAMVMRGLK
jgi:hypothetical protein